MIFRQREHDGNRLQLCNHQQSIGIVRMHDVTRIHQAQSDPTIDRGGNARIGQLQFGIVDLPLIGLDDALVLAHQRFLGIKLLLGDEVLLIQIAIAFEIQLCIFQLRLIARHLPLSLDQLHFKGARVDLCQQLAIVHHLPFFEEHAHQLTVYPALDRDRIHRDDGSQAVQINIDLPGFRHRRHDRRIPRGHDRTLLRAAWLGFTGPGHQDVGAHSQ